MFSDESRYEAESKNDVRTALECLRSLTFERSSDVVFGFGLVTAFIGAMLFFARN